MVVLPKSNLSASSPAFWLASTLRCAGESQPSVSGPVLAFCACDSMRAVSLSNCLRNASGLWMFARQKLSAQAHLMTSATKFGFAMRSSLRKATSKLCAHFCTSGSLRVGTLACRVSRISTAKQYAGESAGNAKGFACGNAFAFSAFSRLGLAAFTSSSGPHGPDKESERSEDSLSSSGIEEEGEEGRCKKRA